MVLISASLLAADFSRLGNEVESVKEGGCDWLHLDVMDGHFVPNVVSTLKQIRALGKKAGISLRPQTPTDGLKDLLDELDLILVMTVNPGFCGQEFMSDQLPKIERIRAMIDKRPICLEVDGGINVQTAKLCRQAGADVLVAGSAIFKTPDYAAAIAMLKK